MSEPTLRDVLTELAKVDARVEKLDTKVDAHRAETQGHFERLDAKVERLEGTVDAHRAETQGHFERLDAKVERVDAKVDAHRAETRKGFAEVDAELTGHTKVHREIENDLEALKRRPATTARRPARRR